jgi:hypothetical protein
MAAPFLIADATIVVLALALLVKEIWLRPT